MTIEHSRPLEIGDEVELLDGTRAGGHVFARGEEIVDGRYLLQVTWRLPERVATWERQHDLRRIEVPR